jgi:hypothetical protein
MEERKLRYLVEGCLNCGGVVFAGRCECLLHGKVGEGDYSSAVACVGEVDDSVAGGKRPIGQFAGMAGIDPLAVNRSRRLRDYGSRQHEGYGGQA